MRKKHWMLSPWFIIFTIVMLLMTTISANYNMIVFYVELGITVLSIAAVIALSLRFSAYIRGIVRSTADRINGIDRDYLERYKYPVAVVGMEGDIVWCNARFRKVSMPTAARSATSLRTPTTSPPSASTTRRSRAWR